ncbi:MAG: DUF2961 domain-containing protein, partial [Gemmatimonadetes bacterium]|nr:DUF2961 domain-containing protein [Gemmatimonadota bacterium]
MKRFPHISIPIASGLFALGLALGSGFGCSRGGDEAPAPNGGGASGLEARKPAGHQRLFDELAPLARRHSARSILFSSFDRDGGNDDGFSSRFSSLRRENGEFVIAETAGAGAIRRIWMTWPGRDVQIRIYLDDHPEPRIDLPVTSFFSGNGATFQKPHVGSFEELGGVGYCYVPIPFAKRVRVTTDAPLRFYQIDIEVLADGEDGALREDEPAKPSHARSNDRREQWRVAPGDSTALATTLSGPGVVRSMTIEVDGDSPPLRALLFSVYWDGARDPAFCVPLSELYGSAFAPTGLRSTPVASAGSKITISLPMPCESMRVVIANASQQEASGAFGMWFEERALDENDLRLHARWQQLESVAGEPLEVLSVNGHGHYVGTLMSATAARGDGFLEGDEMFFVDGDPALTRNGTGTEDYFNSGWYFAGGVRHFPWHGVTFQSDAGAPRFSAYRWHVPDRIPFQESLRLAWEHGEWNNQPGALYSITSFWYEGRPTGDPPPDAPTGWLPRRIRFPKNTVALGDRFHWNDRVLDVGQAHWSDVTDAWSAPAASIATDKVIPFLEGKRGGVARFRTSITIPADGEYAVRLAVARGPGFGRLDAAFDRDRVLQGYDCGADTLEPVHLTPESLHRLSAGSHELMLFMRQPTDTARVFPLPPGSPILETQRRLLGVVSGIQIEPRGPFVEPWRVVG